MKLPFLGRHIADIGDNRYSYPSSVLSFNLSRCNDLVFYGAGHLGSNVLSRRYENRLFEKHRKPEPARPLFYWKNTYTFDGISNVNQAN